MNGKYRGKRVDNGEWAYGYYFMSNDGSAHIIVDHERKQTRLIEGKPFYTIYSTQHEVIPSTVGMWTGEKDVAMKEIYAGDKVKFKACAGVAVVVFMGGAFCFEVDTPKGKRWYSLTGNYCDREEGEPLYYHTIIGTIHDKEAQCS